MTSVEPKVESIEELDFDVVCKRVGGFVDPIQILEECNKSAKYWIEYHSFIDGCKTVKKEFCEEHLQTMAESVCYVCGTYPRLYNYGPL